MTPDSDDDRWAEQLFEAARDERPALLAKSRVLRAVSAKPPQPKGRWLLAALALGAVLLVAFAQRAEIFRGDGAGAPDTSAIRAEPVEARSRSVEVVPQRKQVATKGEVTSAAPSNSAMSSVVAPSRPAAPKVPPATLEQELQMLDAARQALLRGDSGAALTQLSQYERAATRRHLGAEAMLLRIQILAASRRASEASALAREFVAQQPNSPLVDRAKSFVSENIERSEGP